MMDEKRFYIYIRDSFKCQHKNCKVCGTKNIELAHRLHKGVQTENWVSDYVATNYNGHFLTKKNLNKIIHSPLNIVTSCRKHNDYFNCLFKKEEAKELLEKIIKKEFPEWKKK